MDPYSLYINPFKTLGDIYAWEPGLDEYSRAIHTLRSRVTPQKTYPKTLLCHDMAGGYVKEDR